MTETAVFAFDLFAVRVLTQDGEPWFVAADVANVLGYRDVARMAEMLEESEVGSHCVRISSESGVAQEREAAVISESGLYTCVIECRREVAKAFLKWVTSEVLPTIRKTGSHTAPGAMPPPVYTSNLSHSADLAVAADRTFRSFLRASRSAGMPLPLALRAANRKTIERAGMDMLGEIGVDPREVETSLIPGARPPTTDERFLDEWQSGETRFPYMPCSGVQLYAAYQLWCRSRGEHVQRECNTFLFKVGRMPGWSNERRHRFENPRCLGKSKQARTVWPADCVPPPDRTVSEWLTDCYFAFQRALVEAGL